MEYKQMTLAVVVKEDRILLGLKKRGFGQGKWNGFGGKVMAGESARVAASRELTEESGLVANGLRKVGDIVFHNSETEHHRVEIFSVDSYSGEITENDEMEPKWFRFEDIPYDSMWEDDRHWLPLFLSGKSFEGEFFFEEGRLVRNTLRERGAFVDAVQ